MNPFRQYFQAGAAWQPVGLASEFPDLSLDKDRYRIAPRCKAFSIPKTNNGPPVETDLDLPGDLKDQADRGNYKLKVWEVQLRDPKTAEAADSTDKEVWGLVYPQAYVTDLMCRYESKRICYVDMVTTIYSSGDDDLKHRSIIATRTRHQGHFLVMMNALTHFSDLPIPIHNIKGLQHPTISFNLQCDILAPDFVSETATLVDEKVKFPK
ncbi:hypothetical protein BBP40_012420 [Aspergillus hancockii]|nr:hypothetical protein BBP40_012420 [Aspergillus hancockii]